ncbi:MAG: Smr/MutS family protein [Mycoplasmatota bacterium]
MKSLNDIIFVDNLPKLDLHGYDRQSAALAINDFIKENIKLKKPFISIVHGIGSGVIKAATHQTLKENKKVLEYKTYYYNQGLTVVLIDLK